MIIPESDLLKYFDLNMKYFITIFLVLVFICSAGAVLRHEHFQVYSGYLINTVDETITTRSASVCAAACDARNDVIPSTCRTATYNSVFKWCAFSSQGLSETTSGLGAEYKTITILEDCSVAPVIKNGNLSIDTHSSTGSVATLQCHSGFEPISNNTSTVQCSIYSGWYTDGISCFIPPPTSYYGTSFITGFMQSGISNTGVPTIYVLSSEGEAIVTISVPYLAINEQTTTAGGLLTRTFSNTVSSATSGSVSANAVLITSDIPVTLFSGSIISGSSDGSFVLPETSVGSDYIISGHPSTTSGVDEFLIIGTVDGTQVTLDFNNAPLEIITLNRLETYQRQSADMSGTMINAVSPVYVLSGHVCANIPDNTVRYCDHIEEMMPPITSLGSVHVVTFMKPRSDFTISIAAPVSVSVIIFDSLGNFLENIALVSKTAQFRTYTNSATISVLSDSPVLVTQYGHGSGLVLGDPSMMVIPDVTHFGYVYHFAVPTGFDTPSTLAMIMSDAYSAAGLLLDDTTVTPTETIPVDIPGYGIFNVIYVNVTVGYHRLSHTLGKTVSFGAWIYGRTSKDEYALSLGMIV